MSHRPSAAPEATSPVVEPLTLDARPIFARGGTPCSAIDQAVARLRPGQAFVLLVPFEPMPLYGKLEALGFSHITQQEPDGSCRIEFRPTGTASTGSGPISVACGCGK